jgi:xanthine dehydrogenase accessory factor
LTKNNLTDHKVLIRGSGELASAIGLILHRVGFKVIMTELPIPQTIRRTVCFSEAILRGQTIVEEVTSIKSDINNYVEYLNNGKIPVLIDSVELLMNIRPEFYVDARMLKKEVLDRRFQSYISIGIGPGFTVAENCDVLIETMRGHNLGKVLWIGSAQINTGVPGTVGGESKKRVIHSKNDGNVKWLCDFGNIVEKNQVIGWIGNFEIKSQINGMIRGLISPKVAIKKGMKIADIDPRGNEIDYKTISDKARNIGRGVLEAILVHLYK